MKLLPLLFVLVAPQVSACRDSVELQMTKKNGFEMQVLGVIEPYPDARAIMINGPQKFRDVELHATWFRVYHADDLISESYNSYVAQDEQVIFSAIVTGDTAYRYEVVFEYRDDTDCSKYKIVSRS